MKPLFTAEFRRWHSQFWEEKRREQKRLEQLEERIANHDTLTDPLRRTYGGYSLGLVAMDKGKVK